MKYAFPAIFTQVENGEYDVCIPSLPGCRTCGKNLADAILMAEDAMAMWLWDAEVNQEPIPSATTLPSVEAPQFINFIVADTDEYKKKYDTKAVKKTLSIPNWLNIQAEQSGINFSQVLQDALKDKLNVQ